MATELTMPKLSDTMAEGTVLKWLIGKGDVVKRGQVIAEVGRTGNASGAHVHFELRRDRRPEDPLLYLP